MRNVEISVREARRWALRGQLLDGHTALPSGKEGVAAAIERLGYVQIDTISVVNRAHHHTLWTRCPDYNPASLQTLLATDRRVFEYWAHAMAYLPISDYRYYIPRMKAGGRTGGNAWLADHQDVADAVLARIRAEGPLSSKDFELPPGTRRGTWWDWKPAKRALEVLLWRGDLMVAERRGFQKVYDLTERVLPSEVDATAPSPRACARFQVNRALGALGIAREKAIVEFLKVAEKPTVRQAIRDMVEEGEIVSVGIEGFDDSLAYALPQTVELAIADELEPQVHVLSPFDSLVIQRPRMAWLFDFEYTIECYVPAAKRKYGYFVLPLLLGDRFVGRLDAKADRKAEKLIVRKLWIEADAPADSEFLTQIAWTLARFARFNQCTSLRIEKASPTTLRGTVSRHARSILAEDLRMVP